MELELVTVGLDPVTNTFPTHPLEHLAGEVISVAEHFFVREGRPHLLLVVQHRRPAAPRRTKGRGAKEGGAKGRLPALSEDQQADYDRLRAWRNGRAEADGVPVYVVLPNRAMAELAAAKPSSLAEVRSIRGLGERKVAKYGSEILAIFADSLVVADVE